MNTDQQSESQSSLSPITHGVKEVGQTSTAGTIYYEFSDSDTEGNRIIVVSIDGDLIWVETLGSLTNTDEAVERLHQDFDIVETTSFGEELGVGLDGTQDGTTEADTTEPTVTESISNNTTTENNHAEGEE